MSAAEKLVERVGEALRIAWEETPHCAFDRRHLARAAIAEIYEAMKEPNEGMLVAGLKEGDPLGGLVDWNGKDTATREDMTRIFTAMLAASPLALDSQGGEG